MKIARPLYFMFTLLYCLMVSSCNIDEFNGFVLFTLPEPHPSQGTCHYSETPQEKQTEREKAFVFCVMTDTYLWSDKIDSQLDLSPSKNSEELLALLKHSELDHFSFITTAMNAANYFDSGISIADPGLRVTIFLAEKNSFIWVYRSYQGSPAHKKGIVRGNRILSLNGKSIDQMRQNVSELGTSWYEELTFSSHQPNAVVYLDNQNIEHRVDIELFEYAIQTVEAAQTLTLESGEQGFYFAFNGFISAGVGQINQALSAFDDQKMQFAMVDLRKNSGGYTYIANYLASILGGKQLRELPTDDINFSFKQSIFNNKYAAFNRFVPFYRSEQLPHLMANKNFQLQKIVFLVDKGSCSSSELLINSLQAYDYLFDIKAIGTQTCGKPYGMYGKRFGEKMLYAVENKSANAKGYGDYINGIDIDCTMSDLSTATDWGDTQDPVIKTALSWLNTGHCDNKTADYTIILPKTLANPPLTLNTTEVNPNHDAFKVK
jgi:carboxyl-terminal processing protease